VFYDYSIIMIPSGAPLSVPLLEDMMVDSKPDILFVAPSLLEELSESPDGPRLLAKLNGVGFVGGPLSSEIGDRICKLTQVINCCGTTEIMWNPTFQDHDRLDWEYHHYDPSLKGVEFRDRGEGIYEQFLVRHPSTDQYHSAWWTFPHKTELPMHDLYAKHPTRPNYWRHIGRSDDIIVFSNGEKINPVDMENELQACPLVKSVLIVGQGQPFCAALIETYESASGMSEARIIDDLWSYVDKANQRVPVHGRLLSKEHIILVPSSQPFLRAGKGTVQRRATVDRNASRIEACYTKAHKNLDNGSRSATTPIDVGMSADDLILIMQALFQRSLGVQSIDADADVFSHDLDSLGAIKITKQLKAGVQVGSVTVANTQKLVDSITNRLVYSNPTAKSLAAALKRLSSEVGGGDPGSDDMQGRQQVMSGLLAKYTAGKIHSHDLSNGLARMSMTADMTIILTGSSGSLGAYILHALLTCSEMPVKKIFCLNRNVNAASLQKASHLDRDLETNFDRVEFISIDIGKPQLGLDSHTYQLLVRETSYIIHNQWNVNFNLSVESFEPQIAGVQSLILLAAAALRHPPIFFTSSIGTASNWKHIEPTTPVPESLISDWKVPDAQGYSESKFIAEQMFEAARQSLDVSSIVCRIGQIAGPVETGDHGEWNPKEWLPSLIASSKHLRMLPESLAGQDEVRWTPVDDVAQIVVEMIQTSTRFDHGQAWTEYCNLVNPQCGQWRDLVPTIQRHLEESDERRRPVQVVPFSHWLGALQASAEEGDGAVDNSGIKLLDFYQTLEDGGHGSRFETKRSVSMSKAIAAMTPVSEDWMRIWLRQWRL